MLEHLDLKLSTSKAEYKRRLTALQERLYSLSHAMFVAGIPSIVIFEGWATSGKGSTINVLTERLDARGFRVVPIMPPRTLENQYPWLWRFWLKIPATGQMVIFDQSWYRRVVIDRLLKSVSKREWDQAYQEINEFEEQLANDGIAIVKFWLHINKKEQKKRIKEIQKTRLTSWQVSEEDAYQNKHYKKQLKMIEEMFARTEMPYAPWTVVEATNRYFTRLKIYETLIQVFEKRLALSESVEAAKRANA